MRNNKYIPNGTKILCGKILNVKILGPFIQYLKLIVNILPWILIPFGAWVLAHESFTNQQTRCWDLYNSSTELYRVICVFKCNKYSFQIQYTTINYTAYKLKMGIKLTNFLRWASQNINKPQFLSSWISPFTHLIVVSSFLSPH